MFLQQFSLRHLSPLFAASVVAFAAGSASAQSSRGQFGVSFGYDGSSIHSNAQNYSGSGFYYTGYQEGAIVFNLTYDFKRHPQNHLYTSVYGEAGGIFFTHLYNAVGFSVRQATSSFMGYSVYAGAGAGFYTVESDGTGIGGKVFVGLQTPLVFVEFGINGIPNTSYHNKPTVAVGFRF